MRSPDVTSFEIVGKTTTIQHSSRCLTVRTHSRRSLRSANRTGRDVDSCNRRSVGPSVLLGEALHESESTDHGSAARRFAPRMPANRLRRRSASEMPRIASMVRTDGRLRRPAQPSPTIAQCLNGGYGWLEVKCHRCESHVSISLADVRRPRGTEIWKLESAFRCRSRSNKDVQAAGASDQVDQGTRVCLSALVSSIRG